MQKPSYLGKTVSVSIWSRMLALTQKISQVTKIILSPWDSHEEIIQHTSGITISTLTGRFLDTLIDADCWYHAFTYNLQDPHRCVQFFLAHILNSRWKSWSEARVGKTSPLSSTWHPHGSQEVQQMARCRHPQFLGQAQEYASQYQPTCKRPCVGVIAQVPAPTHGQQQGR
jgi:hypothetical protein